MWLCLCAPSMVWAQEYTEANDKHVTTQAVVKVAPPALSPPVLNIKVDKKRADFVAGERCELLILPATPAAKLVVRGVVKGEKLTRTYDYGYRFDYDFMGFTALTANWAGVTVLCCCVKMRKPTSAVHWRSGCTDMRKAC